MKQLLVGTWRLVSYEIEQPSGSVTHPFGNDVAGILIYTADGFMSGQVMDASRAPLEAGYRARADHAAAARAFEGYIAYCGRWTFDEEHSEVIHSVEASLYPNWVGTRQRRKIKFSSPDSLTLSAETVRDGAVWVSRLAWRRV